MLVTPETVTFREPLRLASGESLVRPTVGFERYGALSAKGDNAILVCPAMTHDAHAAGRHTPEEERPGWWDAAIGPGKMLDTDRYCVLCVDTLGGAGGTSGPLSVDPATGDPYRLTFPFVTIADMVEMQRRLVDHLGIPRLAAVIGGCMGGFQVLQWIAALPDRLERAVFISAGARVSAHTIARNEVCRRAVRLDPEFRHGIYDSSAPPAQGMRLASMIGALTWLDRTELESRHGRRRIRPPGFGFAPEFEVEQLLDRIGGNAQARFDPNAFLYVTRAVDYFDLTEGVAQLDERFAAWNGRALAFSYRSDWRYPPEETQDVIDCLRRCGAHGEHVVLDSALGHVAFLLEAEKLRPALASFLEERP